MARTDRDQRGGHPHVSLRLLTTSTCSPTKLQKVTTAMSDITIHHAVLYNTYDLQEGQAPTLLALESHQDITTLYAAVAKKLDLYHDSYVDHAMEPFWGNQPITEHRLQHVVAQLNDAVSTTDDNDLWLDLTFTQSTVAAPETPNHMLCAHIVNVDADAGITLMPSYSSISIPQIYNDVVSEFLNRDWITSFDIFLLIQKHNRTIMVDLPHHVLNVIADHISSHHIDLNLEVLTNVIHIEPQNTTESAT